MNVKDVIEQLRKVKNKESELVFKTGDHILDIEFFAEVVKDSKGVHHPTLEETPNVILGKLSDIPTVPGE